MNPCDNFEFHLLRYLDNELDGREGDDLRAHLKTCAKCRELLKEEQELSGALRSARPLYKAPKELRDRVEASEAQSAPKRSGKTWWRPILPWTWKMWVPATLAIAFVLVLVPEIEQRVRANSYVETAAVAHAAYFNGTVKPDILSSSPEQVTSWFAGKVPFQFRLPASGQAQGAKPAYRLFGASLAVYDGSPAAMVLYEVRGGEKISLLVASSKSAVVGGGDEIHDGSLTFHYRSKGGFKIITWTNQALSYALVSSISVSARESCLVCHQNMANPDGFRSGH